MPEITTKSIFEIIEKSPKHKTLVALVRKAHLVRTLKSKSGPPHVLLAPTDAAFTAFAKTHKVPKCPAALKKILLKHVRPVSTKWTHDSHKIQAANKSLVISIDKVIA